MLKFIARRLLQMIPTVFGVVLITFILFNVAGGDLAAKILGKNVSLEQLENFDEQRGFNRPLFFGTRTKTRAYEDIDFSKGAGKWNSWTNVVYSEKTKTIKIAPNTKVNPVGLDLNQDQKYEWTITYRGSGFLAGQPLTSADWKKQKILFSGSTPPGFTAGAEGLEIKDLTLRRILKSPFDSQLIFYLKKLSHADFGYSETFRKPVAELMLERVGPSLKLTIPIFFIGTITAIILSLVCAFFRDQFIDRFLVVLSVALMSINYLVYIVVGQYILAYKMNLFPVWGYESWQYLILPVTIGVITGLGANVRFYRSIMLDEMYKDYVRTAFAKGVSKPRLLFVHILKNAMVPIVTNVVIAIPFLYSGSLLLERFFGIPGLGDLSVNAIFDSDVDVVRAVVLIGSLMFVFANLLTDICYALVDPRVKLK